MVNINLEEIMMVDLHIKKIDKIETQERILGEMATLEL